MQHRTWAMRGRPRGNFHSPIDTRLLEYLAEISVKHTLDSNEFFDKIVYAWENRRSKCKELTIECRVKMRGRAIFLLTTDYNIVAQFPIPEHLLKEATPLKEFAYIIEREKLALMKKRNENETRHFKIRDLKAGMKRVNLKARVLTISKPQLALTRYNDYVMFANAILTDETGTIKLTLWNSRTSIFSINNIIKIENANVTAYRGELQLRMGRNSKLEVIENYDLALSQKPEII
jgi:replication factor A1